MESFTLFLFGATGDLARTKIWPALYDLWLKSHVPAEFTIIGLGRSPYTSADFREYVHDILRKNKGRSLYRPNDFLSKVDYIPADVTSKAGFASLKEQLRQLEDQGRVQPNHIYHLALLPDMYPTVIELLGVNGFNQSTGWVRLLIEKPFGQNGKSARELDRLIKKHFTEEQTYRIDHYLAKETVQNILAFRFGNGLFEPIWNRDFIDNIQIHMAESVGVEGRGKFYDRVGVLRDVVQNHLLQLLAVTTMEAPSSFAVGPVEKERTKALKSLRVYKNANDVFANVVSGQYEGYREIANVAEDSLTPTFVALKVEMENERWQGVPIYIRSGKKLSLKTTEIAIVFKTPSRQLFSLYDQTEPKPNVLHLQIDPNEGIGVKLFVKKPGPQMALQPLSMQACFRDLPEGSMGAYEKVLFDAYCGDQMLFTSAAAIESQWRFIDPILEVWDKAKVTPSVYTPASWGPLESDALLEREGRAWETCPQICTS